MNTRYVGREARERQLLHAAVRQIARSRPADHTLPSLTLGALSALLALGLAAAVAGLGPVDWEALRSGSAVPLAILTGGGVAWLLGVAGLVRATVALSQATGTKGLAVLALFGNGLLTVGPLLALLGM